MSTATDTDPALESIDLSDPGLWDDGPPYELFARLQRDAPVHFSAQRVAPGEGGFWSITRHEDVRAVTRNYAAGQDAVTGRLRDMFHAWALRDAAVLETVQRRLGDDPVPRRAVNVRADRAALRARRVVQAWLDEEEAFVARSNPRRRISELVP